MHTDDCSCIHIIRLELTARLAANESIAPKPLNPEPDAKPANR